MPNNKQRSEIVTSDGRTDEDVAGQARTIDVSERVFLPTAAPTNSATKTTTTTTTTSLIKQQ
jgi:hypothetical protein